MTAIVMNTLTGAVTEHALDFQSLTPTHYGSATGLFERGGDDDNGMAIEARFMMPRSDLGSAALKGVTHVYVGLRGTDGSFGQVLVEDDAGEEYAYDLELPDTGISRATPGRGLRENTLGLGFANLDGADFRIDLYEADVSESKTRRQK